MNTEQFDVVATDLIKWMYEQKLTEEQINHIAEQMRRGARATILDIQNAQNRTVESIKHNLR